MEALKSTRPSSPGFSTADKAASPAMDTDRALQHYNTDREQYKQMVIRALNSLRADLTKSEGTGSTKVEESKPESKTEMPKVTEPGIQRPKVETKSDKSDIPKKSKQKAKGTITDWPESDEVETLDFGKRS